ncbi:hypothetical protein DICVIV_13656 [Dictyocaulus viviparus]|uniref:Saposin B-type domain-containing protein n=1 Tax=Dictyocaulus viviparus TaxID=29172 RepID=A0A0D8X796_DICVI|nr:hypothetical protein DICVIV_13656 [Dictyocaulus viviparus]
MEAAIFAIRVQLILIIAVGSTSQISPILEWLQNPCEHCQLLLTDVQRFLGNVTELSENAVAQGVEQFCKAHDEILPRFCKTIDNNRIHELFMHLIKAEQEVDVNELCNNLDLCDNIKKLMPF